ncbi:MAG TPA: DUF4410 domain-containing protein [Casimicrobiaceae bacterium]|nr:DUF4410 domain-containing protein [Casimicrobiaceae bacterium]
MRTILLWLALAAFVAGCATSKVTNEIDHRAASAAPSMIYVENFDLGETVVKSDPGTLTGRPRLIQFRRQNPAEELHELSDLLANSLVDDLNRKKLPAQRLVAGAPLPMHGWLVRGAFLEVASGNRLQKAVIGFGAGNSDAQLYVGVTDLGAPPGKQDLLDFNVDSAGNKAPGGGIATIVTRTPYGMAAKFVLERNASEKDIKRAAQTLADKLEKLAQMHAENVR